MAYRAQVMPTGFNQATSAMKHVMNLAMVGASRRTSTRKRRGSSSKKLVRKLATRISSGRRRKSKAGSRGIARLVKGSAAAKRYMAKIRKLRK